MPTEVILILSLFYGSISIVAVVGNFLVIWIVATTRQMQTVTNLFIANLALADVVIGMFAIPFQVSFSCDTPCLLHSSSSPPHTPDSFIIHRSPFIYHLSPIATRFDHLLVAHHILFHPKHDYIHQDQRTKKKFGFIFIPIKVT